MINPFFLLVIFVYQIMGEVLRELLGLPIPGAIIGMLALLVTFAFVRPPRAMVETASALIRFLPLFFIPAGVGIMAFTDELLANLLPIVVALVAGTLVAFVFTIKCIRRFAVQHSDQHTAQHNE
ncbi:MAG: hypothetical protein CSA52_03345 [Gammaproteobacteria bacterium]|nr:MAG: hypothetical protein CSB48_04075 [Pseudomonadota bacterium]PIE38229.1 MAG: hypothetical protein CSA52_03345 [Gammaproteobacteria bacterium]